MTRNRTRTRGTTGETIPEPVEAMPPDDGPVIERDVVRELAPQPVHAGFRRRRLGVSLPGAILGTLLVSALALGVGGLGALDGRDGVDKPAADQPAATEGAMDEPAVDDGTDGDGDAKGPDASTGEGTDGDGKQDGTDAASTAPAGDPVVLKLFAVVRDDGKVRLEWSGCDPEGFVAYKVVRSADEQVTWPKGDNDTLLAAIGEPATTAWTDAKAPAGRKLFYRVFALAETDAGGTVACASNAASVATPKPEPTPEPTPKPTPKPASLVLEAMIKSGHPWLEWSVCKSERFDYYKVVRSKDSTVTWPTGDNDVLIAAIGNPAETGAWDKDAPGGKKLYYRVFCVDKTEAGYVVLASSGVKSVTTPALEPPPPPYTLGFNATVGDGGVLLDWESCGSDAFVFYKVLRSMGENPSYLPWTEGTQVIGVIESAGNSAFQDAAVEPGQTWFYRVQAIGMWNGQKVVLGQTPVIEVSVP